MIDIKELSKPLDVADIEFRVQSVNNGGYATILAYKDARVDQQRLDDVVGALNWKREHTRDNKNCIVSIWDESKSQWVGKEDTGTESNAEAQKGLASDSFKRACFNWGIGRELYEYPQISIKLQPNEIQEKNGKKSASWNFKLKEWKWYAEFNGNKISFLAARDNTGQTRFAWGEMKQKENK
ncbi:Rad52/22 family double-strand break repair protein [Vibrio phage 1.112.O._10N.286.46.B11]|nr:Rad52/22 family double-strand break repair protein [Vibrio phage 1.112.O._10N.286.46.B11]